MRIKYPIPDWYRNMENQTALSHIYEPPDRNMPIKSKQPDPAPVPDKALTLTSTSASANTSESSGCYIATSVYGSYDCPEVWTLRRYRDYRLARTFWGRIFIKVYYAASPTVVRWFGETRWFDNIWRHRLDKMVKSLQNKGFDDTPYEDMNW